ncbi:hypothetical protein VTN77DRAFT_342 [Rasamsonia byssochlamydoides]|uniref:uncharacterized protein n=1 Tax=Rasamsonia byssochlamydoides TaxID=89139 RepID=UPI0037421190
MPDRNLATGKIDESTVVPLPEGNACVRLCLLDGGSFTGSESRMYANVEERSFRLFNWAFLVTHTNAEDGTRHGVLWVYGMSSNRDHYTPWVQKLVGPRVSILDQLRRHSIAPDDVASVIFSHAHWDHCRPIKYYFPQVTAYFGPGTAETCSPGHLIPKDSQWDGRFFDSEHATENWQELGGPWVRFGPFERPWTFSGTAVSGSSRLRAICLAICARLQGSIGTNGLLSLAVIAVIRGSSSMASTTSHAGQIPTAAKHLSKQIFPARDTIVRIKYMEQKFGAHVAFAHDVSWIAIWSNLREKKY